MPREPRRKSNSGIYHIMLRGINRQTIFEDDEDKIKLLRTIKRYKGKNNFKLYGYCLMDNHIHLLMREVEETVSQTIQRISASYVHWYNSKYARCGHLFQGRFKSENVETSNYFITVLRYIHQNPLKAMLAEDIFRCKWTSLQAYLGKSSTVDIDPVLHLFSPNRHKAIQLFVDYMQESNNDQCLDDYAKVRMSDDEVKSYLNKLGFPTSSALQQMEKRIRNAIILELKKLDGVSIRQLARITGISKSVIDRIR